MNEFIPSWYFSEISQTQNLVTFGVVVERALSNLRTRFRIPLPPTKKVFIGFVLYTSGTMKKRLLTLMIKSECINDSVRSLTPTGNCLTDHLPHEWYGTMVPPMTRSGGRRLNNAKCDSLREEKRKSSERSKQPAKQLHKAYVPHPTISTRQKSVILWASTQWDSLDIPETQ